VIFTGQALTASKPLPELSQPARDERPYETRFRIDEPLYGLDSMTPEITVVTRGAMFTAGQRLLVQGALRDGSVHTGLCSATWNIDQHDSIRKYFRELKQGRVRTTATVYVRDPHRNAVQGATVTLTGASSVQALTDDSGAATFPDVPPGSYTAAVTSPGLIASTRYTSQPLVTLAYGGCVSTTLFVTGVASVRGQVLDSARKPMPGVMLKFALQPEQKFPLYTPQYARTDAQGSFQFREVVPGTYLLATEQDPRGTFWFPGRSSRSEATPINVDAGADVNGLQFTIPDSGVARSIRFQLVTEAGAPVPGAQILDWAQGAKPGACRLGSLGSTAKATADGTIVRSAVDGMCYRLRGFHGPDEQKQYYASDPLDIGPVTGDMTVILTLKPMLPRPPRQ
jgi:hypothetical protein